MHENANFQTTAFEATCHKILFDQPEAIGVAFKFLDCGCSLLCGVSAHGDPRGELIHVPGQPAKKGKKPPICFKCRKDGGLDRVIWQGNWPGDKSELPAKELRLAIGKKVFGPSYIEPDA
ncbi:MAG: hypothetical protein P8X68_10260 [Desulfobacterales bacterium]